MKKQLKSKNQLENGLEKEMITSSNFFKEMEEWPNVIEQKMYNPKQLKQLQEKKLR